MSQERGDLRFDSLKVAFYCKGHCVARGWCGGARNLPEVGDELEVEPDGMRYSVRDRIWQLLPYELTVILVEVG